MAQILVVDDTKNIRKMVELTLKAQGHDITQAENGALGLENFGDGSKWDLTLVDQQMPELNGDEFVVRARQVDPTARIVMMTAFATPELASQVMQSGALDFLRKPFTTETLRDVVKVALEKSRAGDGTSHAAPTQMLARPGQEGYKLPAQSWSMNGFTFWLAEQSQKDATLAHQHPADFESGRLYQLRVPDGGYTGCFVGVTPHIQAQIESEVGHTIGPDDAFWDELCGQTLINFLAINAKQPPSVLAVYEVPQTAKVRPSRRGARSFGVWHCRRRTTLATKGTKNTQRNTKRNEANKKRKKAVSSPL